MQKQQLREESWPLIDRDALHSICQLEPPKLRIAPLYALLSTSASSLKGAGSRWFQVPNLGAFSVAPAPAGCFSSLLPQTRHVGYVLKNLHVYCQLLNHQV